MSDKDQDSAWQAIENLKALESDPEAAHSLEDALLWNLVRWVKDGAYARATVLATALDAYDRSNPDRTRWCA